MPLGASGLKDSPGPRKKEAHDLPIHPGRLLRHQETEAGIELTASPRTDAREPQCLSQAQDPSADQGLSEKLKRHQRPHLSWSGPALATAPYLQHTAPLCDTHQLGCLGTCPWGLELIQPLGDFTLCSHTRCPGQFALNLENLMHLVFSLAEVPRAEIQVCGGGAA